MKIEFIKESELRPVLSILICTLEERKNTFLKRLLEIIKPQIAGKNVEIVILSDNAETKIGSKRNLAIEKSSGDYLCFIDDDDIVSVNYVDLILEKIKLKPDVISITAKITTNGDNEKLVKMGIEYEHGQFDDVYYRRPNHLSVHRRENINQKFLDIRTGEDDEWASRRLSEIKTQEKIDEIIYHYDYRTDTKKYFEDREMVDLQKFDSFIDIKINRPKSPDDLEGSIFVQVNGIELQENILEFPLYFIVTDFFGKSVWETTLNPGWFSQWPWLTWTKSKILDNSGNLLWEWEWDPLKDGCICHQIFHLWSLKNRGSFGIAIGTHDGTFGEWVGPVNDGVIKALLIEGSEKNFESLEKNYAKKGWISLQNKLITSNGGRIDFYEGGTGHTNSVIKDHINLTVNEELIFKVSKDSQSLVSLLEENVGTKWLHIDVEGIDDDLILSLRGNEHLLPELIVYEHESLSAKREEILAGFLSKNNYKIYKGESRNSIALKF